MNIIADFAGGGMHAAFGILAALMARERTGTGQYVDIAMSDGVLYLLASMAGNVLMGGASPTRGGTLLNGSVPHYNVYECSDGGWISIGSLEPHFFVNLCKAMECEQYIPHQYDASKREEIAAYFRERFATKTRDEWFEILSQTRHLRRPRVLARRGAARPAQPRPPDGGRGRAPDARQDQARRHRHEALGHARSCPQHGAAPGPHTDDVLEGIGYDAAAIAGLRETQGRVLAAGLFR